MANDVDDFRADVIAVLKQRIEANSRVERLAQLRSSQKIKRSARIQSHTDQTRRVHYLIVWIPQRNRR
jgi:hypothetical protein